MECSNNRIIVKLQSTFLIISLLGTLAIILAKDRLVISIILLIIIDILGFINMVWLGQFSKKEKLL